MIAVHTHEEPLDDSVTLRTNKRTRLLLAGLLAPLIGAAIIAAVLLWPDSRTHVSQALGPPAKLVDATVTRVDSAPCSAGLTGLGTCSKVYTQVTSGPDRNSEPVLSISDGPGQPTLEPNDKIVLGRSVDATGQVTYYFADFQRRPGLLLLTVAFCGLVVLIARWRGLGALLGLGLTYLVVTQFMLPSILDGHSAVGVALAGSSVIVFAALYVAHGLSARTTTAVIGTLASLAVVGVLAVFAVEITQLTGLSSEEATYVQSFAGTVNIKGLLLGGMIIGSLGVLNDMTVTQASAVWEIHRAQPDRSRRSLYASGMRVGRDHIASTVYTLVLAYTGAALPVLILFNLADRSFLDVATGDFVGEELVRTLVGSIGLILSVPLTTGLAAIVAKSQTRFERGTDPQVVIEAPAPSPAASSAPEAATSAAPPIIDVTDKADEPVDRVVDTATVDPEEPASTPEPVYTGPGERYVPPPKAKRGLFRRNRSGAMPQRKLSRRERKFWEED